MLETPARAVLTSLSRLFFSVTQILYQHLDDQGSCFEPFGLNPVYLVVSFKTGSGVVRKLKGAAAPVI